MKELNLCEILKGHEGETFYSPIYGDVTIDFFENHIRMWPLSKDAYLPIASNGHHADNPQNGEIIIFPSKDQRDWYKWLEEQKSEVPKTWDDYADLYNIRSNYKITHNTESAEIYDNNYKIGKAAIAFIKIHKLIEVGYGGNVTKEDYINDEWIYAIIYSSSSNNLEIIKTCHSRYNNIAFHTKEQAKEFFKYPENIELLKDYFMI